MIVAAMLVLATLPSHPKPIYHGCIALTDHSDLGCNSFDIYGCLTLVRVVAFLLLALNLLPNVLPWYHPLVIALLSLNLILIADLVISYLTQHLVQLCRSNSWDHWQYSKLCWRVYLFYELGIRHVTEVQIQYPWELIISGRIGDFQSCLIRTSRYEPRTGRTLRNGL